LHRFRDITLASRLQTTSQLTTANELNLDLSLDKTINYTNVSVMDDTLALIEMKFTELN